MVISIIVPIYKVEKFIDKCVNSIISQSFKDLEIILVDDGSPDSCPKICDAFAEKDGRIKVVHKQNGGLMSARQAGLRVATGDYVGFVDGDDWIEPDMYKHFAEVIEQYAPDIVVSEFIFDYGSKQELSSQGLPQQYFTKNEMIESIYPTMLFRPPYYNFGINPCCWSKVCKRELLEKCLFTVPTEIKIGEDTAFTYPCITKAGSLAYIDIPYYHYRNNPDSMTNSYDDNMENTILIAYNILKEEFSSSGYDFSNSLSYYLLYLFNLVLRNEASPSNKKSFKGKLKTIKKFICDNDFKEKIKSVDLSHLPVHTKLIVLFIRMKSAFLLGLYTMLLRRFL